MIRIVDIHMATEGPDQFPVAKIRVVFDNDRCQSVMVAPTLSPDAVADALTILARRIREDPELR